MLAFKCMYQLCICHILFSLTTQQELSEHREGISKEVEQLSQQLEHSRTIQVINKENCTVQSLYKLL